MGPRLYLLCNITNKRSKICSRVDISKVVADTPKASLLQCNYAVDLLHYLSIKFTFPPSYDGGLTVSSRYTNYADVFYSFFLRPIGRQVASCNLALNVANNLNSKPVLPFQVYGNGSSPLGTHSKTMSDGNFQRLKITLGKDITFPEKGERLWWST